jgi:two-component sensor histidine kinase
MPLRLTGRHYSLRTHLIVFAAGILIPAIILAGVLLGRSAALERAQLEARLIQVAEDLANDIDRDIARDFTLLHTLARMPSLASEDWQSFYAQAKAALQDKAYVVLIDSSMRQLVNTYAPYGSQPPLTGDPETARRMIASKQADVSDVFVSLATKTPVFNVNIPILREGEVRYILHLGQLTDDLVPILRGQNLGPEWTSVVLDRKGAILARSREHEKHVGKIYPQFADDMKVTDRAVIRTTNLDGAPVLRAVVRSRISGWLVSAGIPVAMAEAPLRRGLWQWGLASVAAIAVALGLAWLFARAMQAPMQYASRAALALGRGETVPALQSHLAEANTITEALEKAGVELTERAAQQRLLLNELNHRVKNVLTVVQAVIMRTLSDQQPLREAREQLIARVQALGRAQEHLVRTDWKGAAIKDIVASELESFSVRVRLDGPDLTITGRMVQTLSLLLHELATNAAKHGSLSDDKGRVSVIWSVAGSGKDARFRFRWKERDGPSLKPPSRTGFGTALLESAIPSDPNIKPRLLYEPKGFVYEFDVPLAALAIDR